MLDYTIALLQDFSWSVGKSSRTVQLCRKVQDNITDFSQVDKIEIIRRTNAKRNIPQSQGKNPTNFRKNCRRITNPCFVKAIIKILVVLQKLMKPKVFYINTSTRLVLTTLGSHLATLKWIVEIIFF